MNENISIPASLQNLDKANLKKTIKIRYRRLKKETFSLYLDVWHNGRREYEFLKLYVIGRKDSRIRDRETIRLAISFRDSPSKNLSRISRSVSGFSVFNASVTASMISGSVGRD